MSENDVLREFLLERKDEVIKAMTIDMTFEAREEIIRKEERAEGRAEGKAEGGREMLITLVKNLLSDGRTPEEAAAILHYPIEEVLKIAEM